MCICVYVCVCVCIYAYIYVYICMYDGHRRGVRGIAKSKAFCVCVYVNKMFDMHIKYMYECVYVCVCVCIYAYMYVCSIQGGEDS